MKTEIIDAAAGLSAVRGKLSLAPWRRDIAGTGIVQGIGAPGGRWAAVDNLEANRRMTQWTKAQCHRWTGLAVVNPWYGKRAVRLLREALEGGLAGLYLHPARQGFVLSSNLVDPLIRVCRTYGRPVYCATGTPACAMPFQLAELARRFPAVAFVMGHAAWSDFSGYDLIPAAKQAANILIETSCTVGCLIRAALEELGPERVLFGSGYPRSLPACEVEKIRRLQLPPAVAALVLRENARRLWKLPPCAT